MGQAVAYNVESDNVLARRIVAHWTSEFGAAQVRDQPCQYFYSERIWPDDIYRQLLKQLPPKDLYQPLNIKRWVNADGVSTRDKYYLSDDLKPMGPDRGEFWRQIVLAITSDSIKRLIFRKLKNDIALRLGVSPDAVEDTPATVRCSLTRDIQDYELKPHPDGQPRVVTAQFYLPADDSQRDLGTSFYAPVPLTQRLIYGRFREVHRMPFLPNSGYIFAVNDLPERRSLHGRELIEASGVRHSILVSWRKVVANEDSILETQKQF